jgi:hypothetical protein
VRVTIYGFGLKIWLTGLFIKARAYALQFDITHNIVHSHVFISRCSVAGCTSGRSSFSGYLNYPEPQLPASLGNRLIKSLTNQLTPLNSTDSVWVLYYDRRWVGQYILEYSTHLGLTTRFLFLSDSCGFVTRGALSDDRMSLSFTITAGPRQRTHSRVRVPHRKHRSLLLFMGRCPVTAAV